MRKILFRLTASVIALSMLGSVFFGALPAAAENPAIADGFDTVLENDGYSLGLNKKDASLTVLDKKNNQIWYSSPQNAEADGIASEEIVGQMKSQILVSYYDGQSSAAMDSYTNCVKDGNFEYSVSGKKLSVTFNIGDSSFSADILPQVISQKRLENEILSKLSEDEGQQILKRYKLFSKKELDSKTYKNIRMNYPSIDKHNIYIRNTMPEYIAEELFGLFEKAGYTTEDLQRDCDDNGVKNAYKEKPYFIITLNFELTKSGFKVSLSPDKIKYLKDYKPCRISILPFFGAKGAESSGFMLVPDGCGSLINLNNGRLTSEAYWKQLFGDDGALNKSEQLSNVQPSVLPVFALSSDSGSFLTSIDSGYEAAGITADIAGRLNSYNYIYSFFNLFATDVISLSGNSGDNFLASSEKIFSDDITLSYSFFEPNASYTKLAAAYREKLAEDGVLKRSDFKNADVSIEFLASAGVTKRFLGIPYSTTAATASYSDALKALKELDGIGADVNYKYATDGGYNQKSASKLRLLPSLGTKKQKKALENEASSFAVSYYAMRAAAVKNKNAAKSLNRNNAMLYEYDPVSGYFESDSALSLISASKLGGYLSGIKKSLKSENISAVGIMDIGYQLHSDFNLKNEYDRHKSRKAVQSYLKSLSSAANVFVETGSIFSLSFADRITDIPVDHSGYKIEDTAVPFYQTVVSGYIPYTAPSVNTAPDGKNAFLKAVEYGAQLQYTWICRKPEDVLSSREDYYGFLYSDSANEVKEYVNSYKKLYSSVSGASISDHKTYSGVLSKTVYDNGVTVFVNYGDAPLEADGCRIEPKSFSVTGGEKQ